MIRIVIALVAVIVSSQAALAQPVPLRKEHAYSGPRRPIAQLATVYGTTLTFPLALTYVCEIDGKSYRSMFGFGSISICPSIVYLLPGSHRMAIHHGRGNAGGTGTISVSVSAGRVYEIGIDYPERMRVSARLLEKPQGFVLTYKDVMPRPYASGTRQNSRIDPMAD
jgi:hypothetical protein